MRFADSLAAYRDRKVVEHYDRDCKLQDAEGRLFEQYLRDGMRVLDLGVGAGRTTPFLSPRASSYVGVDFSEEMIKRCKAKYPALDFRVGDASRLSEFASGSADLIVFSFNGLGTLVTDEQRQACLSECARILSPDGTFIFSLHNSRFLVTPFVLSDTDLAHAIWRILYSAFRTLENLPYRFLATAFWLGAGYLTDPALHGGLRIYVSTPQEVRRQLQTHGLSLDRAVPAPHTEVQWTAMTPWYYYAARRAGHAV